MKPSQLGQIELDLTLSFEQLGARYNFNHVLDRHRIFTRLLVEECRKTPRAPRVLDIGCGRGIGEDFSCTREIGKAAGELWGIEPDPSVPAPPPGVFTTHLKAGLEEAHLPAGSFDIAYSHYVMEHVTEPGRFLAAVYDCLKPGGVYLFATINARHLFARVARGLRVLRIDEQVLRAVRGRIVERYHYPLAYRFNTPERIDRLARERGFLRPDYVYLEKEANLAPYLPGPLRLIALVLHGKRRVLRSPGALLSIIGRIRKPEGDARPRDPAAA